MTLPRLDANFAMAPCVLHHNYPAALDTSDFEAKRVKPSGTLSWQLTDVDASPAPSHFDVFKSFALPLHSQLWASAGGATAPGPKSLGPI